MAQGILALSQVVFSDDGQLAIVYAGNWGGASVGRGACFILEQKNGTWKIMNEVILWTA
jgi:hypothetical protein